MSCQPGLKGLFAGFQKKPQDIATGQYRSEDTENLTADFKPKLSSGAGTPADPIILEDETLPIRTLKRKQTIIFKPILSKDKGVAMDTPTSPSHSVGAASTSSTASTIPASKANRPEVHYFCYESRALHGKPIPGKDKNEIILVGFNDDTTFEHLIETDPSTMYKVPRLHIASKETIREDGDVTARMASGYIQQIKRGIPAGATSGADSQLGDMPRLTMGKMNTKNGEEFFMLGADDLIILEPIDPPGWGDGGVPWSADGYNIYPFAHVGHFDRTPLKHFAWEWLKFTDVPVSRPPPAIPGVHIWLIDYELRRSSEHRQKTEVQGHRQIFYGRGVRFVEVRREDKEWKDDRHPRDFSPLKQVRLWKQRVKLDAICEVEYQFYHWPTVGVLACELGDY